MLELVPGGGHRRIERRGKKIDPLHQLFMPSEHQQNGENVGQWCILLQVVDCHIHCHRTLCLFVSVLTFSYIFFLSVSPLAPDQSDTELRHSLANLLGVVLGCPTHSNHLWYHLFHPKELHGTYLTGFMVGNSRLCVRYFVVIRKQEEVRLCFLSFVHCSLINATV